MEDYVYVTPPVKTCWVIMNAVWKRSACNEKGKEMADTSRPVNVYDSKSHRLWIHTCVFGCPVQLPSRNAAPPSHGWAAVRDTCATQTCMHACMQSTVNLKSNRTPITAPCVPAHRRDWMDDTDEELYRLKASKPHCNNHPCRSGCLQQWFQQFPQLFSRCSIKIADYHFKLAVWAFCKLKTATNPTIKIKSTFLTILCFQRENVLVFIFYFFVKKKENKGTKQDSTSH